MGRVMLAGWEGDAEAERAKVVVMVVVAGMKAGNWSLMGRPVVNC